MTHRYTLLTFGFLSISACASLTENCPENPADQTSLLCAAAGHHSGKNQERVNEKEATANAAKIENSELTEQRTTRQETLSRLDVQRDELRADLVAQQQKIDSIEGELEKANKEKRKSESELEELNTRATTAANRLESLFNTPINTNDEYEEQLNVKEDLEQELDRLLLELAE